MRRGSHASGVLKVILSVLFAASMMLADATPAAATAVTPVQPAAAAAPAKKADEDKMVCKTEAVTGSLFPKKTCRLKSEFAHEQQEQRQNLQRMQNQLGARSN
jgi:uncharacterized protein (DUF2147 family)